MLERGEVMLGARIAALRRAVHWSQAELANKLKISTSAVGMYEQGRREPSLALVVDIASVFGVSTDYLLTGCTRTRQDAAAAEKAMRRCVESARQRQSRLSGDEVAALVAAMLLDT